MPKQIKLKTVKNKQSVAAFLNTIEDSVKRKDAKAIDVLIKKVTGKKPVMWGASIVGYGTFTYHRSNGDFGECMAVGFSPRKTSPTIYIMPGYQDFDSLLKKLGKHKKGKGCLYIKRLEDVDMTILEKIIKKGFADLKKEYKVK